MTQEEITTDKFAEKISEELENTVNEILLRSSQDIKQLEGIKVLISWYKKARKNQDDFYTEIIKDAVNEMMNYLPQHYAKVTLNKLQINSKQTEIKFELNFQLESIKPYVEFKIKIDGQKTASGRLIFSIDSNVNFQDIKIILEEKRKIILGMLIVTIQILLVQIPFVELDEPIDLGSKEFQIDLSNFYLNS